MIWLVAEQSPLKNMIVNWDDENPNIWKNNPVIFQSPPTSLSLFQPDTHMKNTAPGRVSGPPAGWQPVDRCHSEAPSHGLESALCTARGADTSWLVSWLSHGWKIPRTERFYSQENHRTEWRFIARRITYFYGPFSIAMFDSQRVHFVRVFDGIPKLPSLTNYIYIYVLAVHLS